MLESQRNEILKKFEEDELFFDEPMKNHTSFKIGGPADLFFVPKSIDHIEEMLNYLKIEKIQYYIIGNGSNLLVKDKGYRGVIIQVSKNLSQYKIVDNEVYAEAGILLTRLARGICAASLEGFEFASGIPGTLGGAVYMNAGAYGGEIKDVLVEATVLTRDGKIKMLTNEALDLSYRYSSLQIEKDIVLSVKLNLNKGVPQKIKTLMTELNKRRSDKQPIEKPSAGSTFKRPVGYYAGKLIMDAGLRGYQIGGARVSNKHCGFIINTGNATCEDVIALINHIQEQVKVQFGVQLEPEVRMIG